LSIFNCTPADKHHEKLPLINLSPYNRKYVEQSREEFMKNRWVALAIIFISYLQFTLNWFCIVPAFGGIVNEMQISFAEVGIIIGTFIAGYGVMHIPGGWIAEIYGMRAAVILGIAVETIGAAVSAWAPSYEVLLVGRLLCGIGGSVYIGSSVGLTTAWFRGKELGIANGAIQGAAFTLGAAIGRFGWGRVIALVGWREGLLIGAGVGLVTLVFVIVLFPTPPSGNRQVLEGNHLDRNSLRRVFVNPSLWIMGLALAGAYGSYLSAAQLLPHYAQVVLNIDSAAAETIGVILLLSGIAGGFIGGWLADRVFGLIPTFFAACSIEAAMFFLMPHLRLFGIEIAAAVIGATEVAAFVPWISIPGERNSGFLISDVPTAVGLMLSIPAVGGAAVAPVFTRIASGWGFDAAWIFQGVVTLGLAFLVFVGKPKRAMSLGAAQNAGD
jgi:predicted MFS family arabinose efflux permease